MSKHWQPPFNSSANSDYQSIDGDETQEEAQIDYAGEPEDEESAVSDIEQVRQRHEARLLNISGVVGVGIGDDEIGNPEIVVYLRDESVRRHIPATIEGYQVRGQVTGEFDAY